jgi:hypothetical protein
MEREQAINNLLLVLIDLEYAVGDLECVQGKYNDASLKSMLACLLKAIHAIQTVYPYSCKY